MSILILIFYSVAFPILMLFLLDKNRIYLHDPLVRQKYDSAILNVDYLRRIALLVCPLSLIRKFLFSVIATSFGLNIAQICGALYIQ